MNRFLFRGARLPWDNPSQFEYILKDLAWSNIGNMLFSDSMARALMTSMDDTFTLIGTGNRFDFNNASNINEQHDYFIMPYANAFRLKFDMESVTRLIKSLKIPCIVTGIGFQGNYEPNLSQPYPFDEQAKAFCIAVLDKSASIGVRGEITHDYLVKHLGLPSNRIDIIGCPSMYSFGERLPLCEKKITGEFSISTSLYTGATDIMDFIAKIWNNYSSSYFIPQATSQLELLYTPSAFKMSKGKDDKYNSILDSMYSNGRVMGFVNVPSWIQALKRFNLAIGCAIHGSIAPILAGTPTVVIPTDSRVRELAEYHRIPILQRASLNSHLNIVDRITEIYEKTDFSSVHSVKKNNFDKFVSFLNRNGLPHIYSESFSDEVPPCDVKMSNVTFNEPLIPFSQISYDEVRERLKNCYGHLHRRIDKQNKEIERLKKL